MLILHLHLLFQGRPLEIFSYQFRICFIDVLKSALLCKIKESSFFPLARFLLITSVSYSTSIKPIVDHFSTTVNLPATCVFIQVETDS